MKHLALALLATTVLAQPPAITTKAYDNARSGMNPHETVLTQDAIAKHGLVLQTIATVYGDARGCESQPLFAPAVQTTKGVHDVMICPSMAGYVQAWDAETGAELWKLRIGTPINSSGKIDFHQINDKWSCLSTGVLIPNPWRWYGVCWTSLPAKGQPPTGSPESGRYQMFGIDLATGSEEFVPVDVQGSDASMWKQRSALTYLPKANVIAFAHGSVYEMSNGYTGGVTVFDLATNTVSAQLPLTSGIWMAGQGLVADADENMYAITGNGAFDPSKGWYGESFIGMKYMPSVCSGGPPADTFRLPCSDNNVARRVQAGIDVIDQWAPWTDAQRTGQAIAPKANNHMAGLGYGPCLPAAAHECSGRVVVEALKMSGMSAPSEAVKPVGSGMSMPMADAHVEAAINAQGQVVARVYPTMARGEWSDEDWGSAGPACVFAIGVCVATGKDGIGYPIRTSSLGGTTPTTVGTVGNYSKLAAPCAWLTMSPGNVPCDPADPRALNFFPNGVTAHLHMTPVQMYDPLLKSWVLFVWGENAQLHKWKVGNDGKLVYIAQSREYASVDVRGNAPGGMPGGFCSGSDSADDPERTALLFCSVPYGDANATITNGRLLVYDPVHLATDGSLKVLWDSQKYAIPYTFNKFMAPTVWNGRVYLPNYNGGVMVFGLGK